MARHALSVSHSYRERKRKREREKDSVWQGTTDEESKHGRERGRKGERAAGSKGRREQGREGGLAGIPGRESDGKGSKVE